MNEDDDLCNSPRPKTGMSTNQTAPKWLMLLAFFLHGLAETMHRILRGKKILDSVEDAKIRREWVNRPQPKKEVVDMIWKDTKRALISFLVIIALGVAACMILYYVQTK